MPTEEDSIIPVGPVGPARDRVLPEEIIIDYIAQSKPHININILLSLLEDLVGEFKNEEIQINLAIQPISLFAILDYIMTTPGNFNPNILREALTNTDALIALTSAYAEKNGLEKKSETSPSDSNPDPATPSIWN